jgi:VWFA-related protein
MKRHPSLAFVLILQLLASAIAQTPSSRPATPQQQSPQSQRQPQPQQQQARPDEDDVVRITTNLVQVDAVVTDKSGKPVPDLKPEDFEILEDGRAQPITNFSYVELAPPVAAPRPSPSSADKTAPPLPPTHLRPEQVRRTFALVVDDLTLSFESTFFVREALKKFVDRQMQPGDLVAIIRTGGGIGALQQFTSDKRQLYAAIERVRWNMQGLGNVGAFASIRRDNSVTDRTEDNKDLGPQGVAQNTSAMLDKADKDRNLRLDTDDFREEIFSVGTLGALNYVVRGLRDLPGRKSVLLISDGLRIFSRNNPGASSRVEIALRRLIDLANRASVVISTMDARGLEVPDMLAASDNTFDMSTEQIEAQLNSRRNDFIDSQSGLIYLAQQTGGIAVRNNNDLNKGIQRVLDNQKGYYLIGYRPDKSTFDPATGRRLFHKLTIKTKRPGLNVRYRTGFYGITDEQAKPVRRTLGEQMLGALTSPFSSAGVNLRLTSIFINDAKTGSYMRSMLHINARDLTFTDEPGGSHKAVFDLLAMTFGDNGQVLDQLGRTHTFSVQEDAYRRLLQNGFDYFLTVPIKKAGAYQLRVALRDTASQRIGSATQFVEVPNLSKNRLTLSGIIVQGAKPGAVRKESLSAGDGNLSNGAGATKDNDTASDIEDPQSGPAVRLFHTGMMLRYGFLIFNAALDKATGKPQLLTQVRLFRNGQEVYAGSQVPYNGANQTDLKRLLAGGALNLGVGTSPGEYILQVVVTDTLAKEKYRTTTQWTDFEIVQ